MNPYQKPPVPGPYGPRPPEEVQDQKSGPQRDNSSQQAAGVALLPQGDVALVASQMEAVQATSVAASRTVNAGQTAVGSAGTQTAVLNALGAAHALVNGAIGVIASAASVVAGAITAATAIVGPFVVIKVAASYGITDLAGVQSAVQLISDNPGAQKALAEAIEGAIAKFAGLSEAQMIDRADEILASIEEKAISILTASHDLPPTAKDTAVTTDENAPISIALGITDDGTLQYEIVSDPSGAFSVTADGRLVAGAMDYETTAPFTVIVRATDEAGHMIETAVTITLANVNEAPDAVTSVSGTSVSENSAGTLQITVNDPDDGEHLVEVAISPQNYENTNFVDVPWSYTDSGGLTISGTERVSVIDINEAPGASQGSVTFDGATLTLRLNATDPDGDPVTYEVDGVPIAGNELTWTASQLAGGAPSVRIVAVDPGGLKGSEISFDPPRLALDAASSNPVPPTIFGISKSYINENSAETFFVTSWDAVDGVVTTPLQVVGGDYEALGAGKSITVHASVTNSLGLTAEQDFSIAVVDVNERPVLVSVSGPDRIDENQSVSYMFTYSDPEQGTIVHTRLIGPYNSEAGVSSVNVTDSFTDAGGLIASASKIVQVLNSNEVFFSGVSTGKLNSHWSGDDIWIGDGGPETNAVFMEVHFVTSDGQPLSFSTWAGPVHISGWSYDGNNNWTAGIAANQRLDGDFDIGVYATGPGGDITYQTIHVHIL